MRFLALASMLLLGCGDDDVAPADAGSDAAITALDASTDAATAPDAGPASTPFRVSLSVSPFVEYLVGAGLRFEDGSTVARTTEELQRSLVARGATEVYARVSTERVEVVRGGRHAMETVLLRAALARDLGLPLNPELGLFGSYGDVSCQTPPSFAEYPAIVPPGAWETLTIDQMVPLLRAYAADVATELLATGVTVEIWDVGNEVDFGTAGVAPQPLPGTCNDEAGGPGWYHAPDGVDPEIGRMSVTGLLTMSETARIAWLEARIWPHVARLLDAAAQGIRSVVPDARIATHVSGVSATPLAAPAFYRAMAANGLELDVLGFSFYPTSAPGADRLGNMRTMVEMLTAEFGKPVFMAEVGYPATGMIVGGYSTWNNALPGYPLTNDGQAMFFRDVMSWAASGALDGVRPWAPEVAAADWAAFAFYEPALATTLRARPALAAIPEGLAAPNPDAI